MQSARDQQIRALLRAALARPPGERASFITELAGGDEQLRRSVQSLLEREEATALGNAAATRHETEELPLGALLGHYRIDAVLGRGGMGIVYRATDTKLGRPVAIKLISGSLADPAASERFRTEAQTASSLNHPHIVTVHDVGEHAGAQFIVSELVDGGTLEDWTAAARRRTWRQSVELLIGVADALSAAHAAQVLHRDIKPSNILIGANGYAKLADFGLAKLVEPKEHGAALTRPGVVVGTVAYMSPEQVAGLPLDARSDVFSFGIVLYELLAGRRPFEGATDLETLKAIAHATPDPLPDGTPEALRIAVDKALEKEPADRYQAMRELVVDLRRVVRKSGSSQTALAASDAQLVASVVTRHPMTALAALATVVVFMVGAAYSLLGPDTAPSPLAVATTSRSYEITPLTTTGTAVSPAISPDGRFVVYAQRDNGSAIPNSLWMRQIGTSSRSVPIVDPEPDVNVFGPTVTPDGNFVHFIRQDTSRLTAPELWRAPFLGGGTPQPIAENVWGPVGWAPDGQRMAFLRLDFETQESFLVVASTDGTDQQELARRKSPVVLPYLTAGGRALLVRPAWSPDGSTIAMFEFNLGEPAARVVFIDVATGAETVRDAHARAPAVEGLAWLGPTSLVLSQSDRVGRGTQLWRMSYPDGAVTPWTNDLSSYQGVDVDQQRRNLVTSRREERVAVYIDAADAETEQIAPPVPYGGATNRTIVWGGERLIYDSAVNGRPAIATVPVGGGAPEYVAADAYSVAATSDGSTIVFARDGVSGVWRADGRGGGQRQVIAGDATDPLVLPDDRTVLFVSSRSGRRSLWSVPIDGGEPKLFVDVEIVGRFFDVSRDGRRLLFTNPTQAQPERPVVTVCDLPDCVDRRGHQIPFEGLLRWMPDGEHIAYRDASARNIWAMPLDGGEPRPLTALTDGGVTVAFNWSPDGTRLARLVRTVSDDIVLLNLSE